MRLKRRILILLPLVLPGMTVPFIPSLVIIEMFYLLIPFGIIFISMLVYFTISVIRKKMRIKRAIFLFSILPIFISSQLFSVFMMKNIRLKQRENLIGELSQINRKTGEFPKTYSTPLGIHYQKLKDNNGFIVKYSGGFLVTEEYDSRIGIWESYGWND